MKPALLIFFLILFVSLPIQNLATYPYYRNIPRIPYGQYYKGIPGFPNAPKNPTTPTDSTPTDPGPTNPGPTDPAPKDPGPTDPAPKDPGPTDPAPTDPAIPTQPVDPTPVSPIPTDPKPVGPIPTDPAPAAPIHTDPTPAAPINMKGKPVNNERVMEMSKQLCVNCPDESIQWMYEQNLFRAAKGENPFKWDKKLEDYAKNHANVRKADCELIHSKPQGIEIGENIFWGGGKEWGPKDAVGYWSEEEKYFHYDSNTCDPGEECLHYTQIVWKKTTRVGCASVVCNSGDVFMTCNYYPPGNWDGEKPY